MPNEVIGRERERKRGGVKEEKWTGKGVRDGSRRGGGVDWERKESGTGGARTEGGGGGLGKEREKESGRRGWGKEKGIDRDAATLLLLANKN